ncbi:calponin homology domain-containing protein DDB_G0272472-like [Drosophila miranda]|uniref:calponin homology domain-containing protein DDB_G0272472-like n=1 Tax=Drosophila miranda TaxID=7229 RepID=UPI00143F7516|nr:calponin homology domain-containing protein DDB_G0272472-like [Drosophila miranda]
MTVTNKELNKDNANVSETPGKAVNQRVSRSSFEPLPRIDDRQTFEFVQRKVTIMSSQSPFAVSKKKLKPWKRKVSSRTFIALTLKSLSRRRDLSTVLLLICPSSKCDCHRIHIYSSRSHKHLGSAKLTIEEADLLESHRSLDNYSVAYCSLPLTLQDAASNSLIKKQIFDLAQDPSQIPRHLLHQGKPLCISHKSKSFFLNDKGDDQYIMGDFKDQSNKTINSRTLEERFLFLKSQDKKEQKKALQSRLIIKERQSQLRLLARKIRQRSYRESVAEPVKSLSERKKSVHTSPLLTPGSAYNSQTAISGTDDAQGDSQQTLRESPRRFTSTSLCKPITNEFPKDKKEDERSSQKRIRKTMPESPRRLPSIRNYSMRQIKHKKKRKEHHRKPQEQNQRELVFSPTRDSVLHKRVAEEDDPNKQDEDCGNVQGESHQAWPQLKNDEAQRNPEENSSLKEEHIPQPLPESPRRLPPTRNSASAEDKTGELQKKRKEHHRKPQEQNQRELVFSPTRNSVLQERVAEEDDPNKQDEDWGKVQEESQQAWPRVKNDEAKRNPEENSSLKEEQIPQPLPESPRRLPPTRNSASAEDKTGELQKKRKEYHRKPQEQNQRELVFSPTRNSVLHKRVAEEDDPNKQDEDCGNVQGESHQAWPQLKNDEAKRNPEENSSLKKERIPQPLPKSPRRLPHIRNTALAQGKTDALGKKREEDRRKQQERNQRVLAFSPTRNFDLRKRVAQEAAPNKQEKSLPTMLEFPRRLPFMRSTALRKLKAYAASRKSAEDDRPKQEVTQQTWPESPRRLSSIRNSAMRRTVTDELDEEREEERCKQQSALSQRQTNEGQRNPEEDSGLTEEQIPKPLSKSPRRLPSARSLPMRHTKIKKKQKEDKSKPQEQNQRALVFPPIRNSLLHKRVAEDDPKKQVEESRSKQEKSIQILLESPRRLPFMRSTAPRKLKAYTASRKSAEDDRPKQEVTQQTWPESPRRLSSIRNSAMRRTVTDELDEEREEERCKQQSALSQRQTNEGQRNPEEDSGLTEEQIPKPLSKSPRRLPSARSLPMRHTKIKKKQKEDKSKPQKQNQRALVFPPIRNSLLHKRVAEDDPKKQVEESRSKQEKSIQILLESPRRLPFMRSTAPRTLKAYAASRKSAEDDRPKQEVTQQTWPESPRRLSSIRNSAMRQTKTDELEKKRDEGSSKQQSPLSQCKTDEARDVDSCSTQERIPKLFPESPRRLPFMRTSVLRKPKANEVTKNRAEDGREEREQTMRISESPRLSAIKRQSLQEQSVLLKNAVDRTVHRNVSELARKRLGTTTCRTPYSAPKAETRAEPDKTEVVTLISPVNLVDSVGHVPTLFPGIECPNSIFQISSTSFCRLYKPVKIPAEFSPAACLHLKGKLSKLNTNRAFSKFVNLVNAINSTANPLVDHLLFFFQFAELIDLKMYARKILYRSRSSSTEEAEPLRFQIECYVFEDRRDYVTSISMASEPLLRIREAIPGVERRLKLIDDVFELTNVPPIITKCLKMALNAVDAAPLYHIIGEMLYAMKYPEETLIQLNCTP